MTLFSNNNIHLLTLNRAVDVTISIVLRLRGRRIKKNLGIKNLLNIILVVIVFMYYTNAAYKYAIEPAIVSGDDSMYYIHVCLYFNPKSYITEQYPNIIHYACHIISQNDPIKAVFFFKIFTVINLYLLPILASLIILRRGLEPLDAGLLCILLVMTSPRYFQTFSDGSTMNIFGVNSLLLALYFMATGNYFISGFILGVATLHFYSIINFLVLIPFIPYLLGSRSKVIKLIQGVLLGAAPSIPKYIFLLYNILSGIPVVGIAVGIEKPNLIRLMAFSFTPYLLFTRFEFLGFLSFLIILSFLMVYYRRQNIFGRSLILSLLIYIITMLLLNVNPNIQDTASVNLMYRLARFLPLVTTMYILFLIMQAKPVFSLRLPLLSLTLLLIIANYSCLWHTPGPLNRIENNAFYTLVEHRTEICSGKVIGISQVTSYLLVLCPNVTLIQTQQTYMRASPADPQVIEGMLVLEKLRNYNVTALKSLGYEWIVLQEPLSDEWYDPSIKELAISLVKNIDKFGKPVLIIKNYDANIYIISLKTNCKIHTINTHEKCSG